MENVYAAIAVLVVLVVFMLLKVFLTMASAKTAAINNLNQKTMLESLIALAGQKVLMVEQTYIQSVKKGLQEGTIKSTDLPSAFATAKNMVVDAVVRDAKALGSWEPIAKKMGADGCKMWLSDVVESQVAQIPSSGTNYPYQPHPSVDVSAQGVEK